MQNWRELRDRAGAKKSTGDWLGAIADLESALDLVQSGAEKASIQNSLAALFRRIGDFARAEQAARQSLQIEKQSVGEGERYATYCSFLAMLLSEQKRFIEAEIFSKQALEIFSRHLGAENDFVRGLAAFHESVKQNRGYVWYRGQWHPPQ